MRRKNLGRLAAFLAAASAAATASAAVTPPAGYIYSSQLLGDLTQGCIAAAPGGTFVGVGPSFTANAQSITLARESGDLRLVASGFNSISDCAYDAATDTLYVTDNADNGDFGIVSPFAAQTGDTVFAIPSASTASGLSAPGLELLPPNSVPFAANVTVDAAGNVYVATSEGGGNGTVLKIVGNASSIFVPGLDFTGGLAFNPADGNLFVAQTLASFDAQIDRYTAAGVAVPPVPFAGPGFGFGTIDLAFDSDGRLLAAGAFAGDVVSFDPANGTSTAFASGLNFANGVTVDPFTGRVELLSSTFANLAEDKSLHRFTKIAGLTPGKGSVTTECLHEAYGLALVDGKAVCVDGTPCDEDGTVNDSCLFPVGFCFNVDDPNFATCSNASNIASVVLSANRPSAALAAARAQLSAALPLTGSSCLFSDGFFVPLKITSSGVKKKGTAALKVKATTADNRKDTDTLKLECHPAP